jgi:hypothetical protein
MATIVVFFYGATANTANLSSSSSLSVSQVTLEAPAAELELTSPLTIGSW